MKVTITVEDSRVLDEKKGWEAFRRLGKDAAGSGLSHVSVNHDQYLYRKSKASQLAKPGSAGILPAW